jgi:hypothetical protein
VIVRRCDGIAGIHPRLHRSMQPGLPLARCFNSPVAANERSGQERRHAASDVPRRSRVRPSTVRVCDFKLR